MGRILGTDLPDRVRALAGDVLAEAPRRLHVHEHYHNSESMGDCLGTPMGRAVKESPRRDRVHEHYHNSESMGAILGCPDLAGHAVEPILLDALDF